MPKQNIGEAIAREREKKGLSQRQLANAVGISNAELSKIESGEREIPNPKILKKISKHINLNYNDMLSMIGLGTQLTTLNPFIRNYYENLKGKDVDTAWLMATSSIKNNDVLIETIQNQINSNKDMDIEKKEILLDTIQDLEYQKETNVQIVKILDELRYDKEAEDAKRNAENNDVLK